MSRMNIIEHTPNLVHLTFPKDKNVTQYELRGARSLDDAYVGSAGSPRNGVTSTTPSTVMFTVQEGSDFRSTGLRRKRLGLIEESGRNLTVVKYDPDEFTGADSTSAPADREWAYLTTREFRLGLDDYADEQEIHIVPPPDFYVSPHPIMVISGTAPLISGTAAGSAPLDESMVIVLPKYLGSFTLSNTGSNPIFVAFDKTMPMREIPNGETISLTDANENLLILAATTAATTFSLFGAIMNAAI